MRALITIAVVALAIIGCGAAAPEDDVRSAWEAASHAVADGDATEFCALVSSEGKDEITARTGLGCESAVRLLAVQLDTREKDAIRSAAIRQIEVRGDSATVTYDSNASLEMVGFTGRTSMTRVDGRWLLSGI